MRSIKYKILRLNYKQGHTNTCLVYEAVEHDLDAHTLAHGVKLSLVHHVRELVHVVVQPLCFHAPVQGHSLNVGSEVVDDTFLFS